MDTTGHAKSHFLQHDHAGIFIGGSYLFSPKLGAVTEGVLFYRPMNDIFPRFGMTTYEIKDCIGVGNCLCAFLSPWVINNFYVNEQRIWHCEKDYASRAARILFNGNTVMANASTLWSDNGRLMGWDEEYIPYTDYAARGKVILELTDMEGAISFLPSYLKPMGFRKI